MPNATSTSLSFEQRPSPEDVAQKIVQRFQNAEAVFLAGSVIRGEGTPTSDLDIVIVTQHSDKAPYRESLIVDHWPIELFVHTATSLETFFQSDCQARTPSLPNMCHEGRLITPPNALSQKIRQRAAQLLQAGPAPLSETTRLQHRYQLTDLLDDLKGCHCPIESEFIVGKLLTASIVAFLAHERCWSGSGKWLWRALRRSHPRQAEQLAAALENTPKAQAVAQWVTETVLSPLGGPLFAGYSLVAPR